MSEQKVLRHLCKIDLQIYSHAANPLISKKRCNKPFQLSHCLVRYKFSSWWKFNLFDSDGMHDVRRCAIASQMCEKMLIKFTAGNLLIWGMFSGRSFYSFIRLFYSLCVRFLKKHRRPWFSTTFYPVWHFFSLFLPPPAPAPSSIDTNSLGKWLAAFSYLYGVKYALWTLNFFQAFIPHYMSK